MFCFLCPSVLFAVQALVVNTEKVPVADLLLVCRQQRDSDSMVLFLRAITAAGIANKSDELLECLQCMTESFG